MRLTVAAVLILGVLPPVMVGAVMFAYIYLPLPGDLPEPTPLELSRPTIVYDQEGVQIGEFRVFDSNEPMTSEDLPDVLRHATVAAEDRRFYGHNGVDPQGILRALVVDIRQGEASQGGSTITQQWIKQVFVGSDRTLVRKAREAFLAARAERQLDKDEILYRYLQVVYFGEGAYGAAAAAETYFHKHVSELSLSEAALLAGVIPSPTAWNPRENPATAERRRVQTLNLMLAEGYITLEEHEQAVNQPVWLTTDGPAPGPVTLVYPPPKFETEFPYFMDYVRRFLVDEYGEDMVYTGGLRVYTTLDRQMQAAAKAETERVLATGPPGLEMSIATIEPGTGFVRAMVGGRDYNAPGGQVNLALGRYGGGSGRQPGSAYKPFVLAYAFEQGISPNARYSGAPQPLPDGTVVNNYGGAVYGNLTLTDATRRSANTPFTRLIEQVGVAETMDYSRQIGVSSVPDFGSGAYGVSVALGALDVSPLDMASAYGTFAARGILKTPSPVSLVTDADGDVVTDFTTREGSQVMDPNVADNVNHVLTGVLEPGGTASNRGIGRPAAGKTGTTTSNRDAWFVGYTPSLSTSVWIGYRDSQEPLRNINGVGQVTGGSIPAQTWQRFMSAAHTNIEPTGFSEPAPILPRIEQAQTTTTIWWAPGGTGVITTTPSPTYVSPPGTAPPPPPPTNPPPTTTTTTTTTIPATTTTRPSPTTTKPPVTTTTTEPNPDP